MRFDKEDRLVIVGGKDLPLTFDKTVKAIRDYLEHGTGIECYLHRYRIEP